MHSKYLLNIRCSYNNDAGNTALRSSQKEHIQSSETPCSSSINKINTLPPVCTSVDPLQIPKSKKLLRSSVARELNRLEFKVGISGSALKDTRKRKDISMVRPLFSRHLGDDIIKQQKKVIMSSIILYFCHT